MGTDMDGQDIRFNKKLVLQLIYFGMSVLFLFLMVREPLSRRSAALTEQEYKDSALHAYEKVLEFAQEKLDAGVKPAEFGDMDLDQGDGTDGPSLVRQVEEDQHWINGTDYGEPDAVYMADGNGTVVYFSYHNGIRASTWSGPSTDPDFVAEHGGWVGGKGAGWSGYSVF